MSELNITYRAVQAIKPGELQLVSKPLVEPETGYVRVRVEACGVCHSDAATVQGVLPIQWPRVPGHEVIGRIDAVGAGVAGWSVGDRVGVGFLAGNCGYCARCRAGDLVNYQNQEFTGVHRDGGYAEVLITKASSLVSVPADLNSVQAAPLLCAGLTTFSALRNAKIDAGERVAILGVGGLGHLAVQYARYMGYEVIAIGRGIDKEALARKLGAHHYIDSSAGGVGESLQKLGGVSLLLATASAGKTVSESIKGLGPRGKLIAIGVSPDPIEVSSADLIFGGRTVEGALTGDSATADATLRFSSLTGVAAMIETMPLEKAPEAYARMMSNQARFRIVLTMSA